MKQVLENKRIWLIGASFGIGEALAKQLAVRGAKLVLSARSSDKIHQLAATLGKQGCAVTCDVTDYQSVLMAYQEALATFGGLDMVIYNAGAYEPASAAEFNLEQIEQMINVNLHGAIRVVHTVLPDMKRQAYGAIVLVGSVAGYRGLPKAMGYGLSKAAIIHLAENLRQDLDGTGIAVQLVNPGFVKTRLTDKNHFAMPLMVTPEKAAHFIADGLEAGRYEIHFPPLFTWFMKTMAALPASAYFWLSKRLL
jgi:short-subunit dehydrogenase